MGTPLELQWEVHASDPGHSFTDYCSSPTEILELCGRLLYGNTLFDVLFLTIQEMSFIKPDTLADTFSPIPDKKPEWIVKVVDGDGRLFCRQLESKYELFGVLIADVLREAQFIEVRHISNACPDNEA
jgi:hypothetical protein